MTQSTATRAIHCPATLVHYEPYRGRSPELASLPWVAAAPSSAGLVGHLFYYDAPNPWKAKHLRPLNIYAGGASPDGRINMKVLWELRDGVAKGDLRIRGTKLEGSGGFKALFQPAGQAQFPSIVDVPEPGCWRLHLTTGTTRATVTVIAVPGGTS